MNKKIFPLISILLLAGVLLSACTAASTNWAGVSQSDTAIYYAGGTQIFALRPDNGNKIWTYPAKAAAATTYLTAPTVAGDQLIVGDYLNSLVSLNAGSGTLNWTFSEGKGKYVGSALAMPNLIIAPNADGHLYALDLQGNLKWTFTGQHSFWSQPVTDGTNIYASSLDHFLYGINAQDGSMLWKVDLGASLVASPLLENGVLYQGTIGKEMNAVDAASGRVLWTQKIGAGVWSSPVVSGTNIMFGDQGTNVYILNTSDGAIVKKIDVGSAVIGSGAPIAQGVAFGTEAGNLVLISPDGSILWTRTIGGKLYSNLVSNSTMVLVVETKGDKPLVALDTNGTELWNFAGK